MKQILRALLILVVVTSCTTSRKATGSKVDKTEILDSPKYKIPEELRTELQ